VIDLFQEEIFMLKGFVLDELLKLQVLEAFLEVRVMVVLLFSQLPNVLENVAPLLNVIQRKVSPAC